MDLGIHETVRQHDGGMASEVDGKLERCVTKKVRGAPVLVGTGVRGSNREGRHHMSNEPIGELDSGGPRTEVLVGSKAALATDSRTRPGEARAVDSGRRACSRDCSAISSVPVGAEGGGESRLTTSNDTPVCRNAESCDAKVGSRNGSEVLEPDADTSLIDCC